MVLIGLEISIIREGVFVTLGQTDAAQTLDVTVGFDIGGTNMRAAAVDAHGAIIHTTSMPTPRTDAELDNGIVELVQQLQSKFTVSAVGLAIAGFIDPGCEIVRFAPHLPWRDKPVRKELEQLLGIPVRIEHDANSAAWGEYRFGAARGHDNWVLFALGTGIGATLMEKGDIYRGAFGTAPEFGHLTVVRDGRPCPCGKKGCLERYCSGTALVDTALEMLEAHPTAQSCLRDAAQSGIITGKQIAQCARQGDELALRVIDDFASWLGIGLSMVADVLDPGLIAIAGGVSGASDLYLDKAIAEMKANMVGAGHRPTPQVLCAELGADAGMIGVADLARQQR